MDAATQRRAELRRAIVDLNERGLFAAAKWAAEQLAGRCTRLLFSTSVLTTTARLKPLHCPYKYKCGIDSCRLGMWQQGFPRQRRSRAGGRRASAAGRPRRVPAARGRRTTRTPTTWPSPCSTSRCDPRMHLLRSPLPVQHTRPTSSLILQMQGLCALPYPAPLPSCTRTRPSP